MPSLCTEDSSPAACFFPPFPKVTSLEMERFNGKLDWMESRHTLLRLDVALAVPVSCVKTCLDHCNKDLVDGKRGGFSVEEKAKNRSAAKLKSRCVIMELA